MIVWDIRDISACATTPLYGSLVSNTSVLRLERKMQCKLIQMTSYSWYNVAEVYSCLGRFFRLTSIFVLLPTMISSFTSPSF